MRVCLAPSIKSQFKSAEQGEWDSKRAEGHKIRTCQQPARYSSHRLSLHRRKMSSARIRYLLNTNILPPLSPCLVRKSLKWREPTKAHWKTTTLNSPIIHRFANNVCLGTKNPKPGMSALHSVTHPRKMNLTDTLRASTLPVASTPLQGKEEYPVFNWQLSQRLLSSAALTLLKETHCVQLSS